MDRRSTAYTNWWFDYSQRPFFALYVGRYEELASPGRDWPLDDALCKFLYFRLNYFFVIGCEFDNGRWRQNFLRWFYVLLEWQDITNVYDHEQLCPQTSQTVRVPWANKRAYYSPENKFLRNNLRIVQNWSHLMRPIFVLHRMAFFQAAILY